MTTFELPGCVDMWTVLSGNKVRNTKASETPVKRSIMLLALKSIRFNG